MPPLRLAFMGTPDFAAASLAALIAAGHDIAAVYSQPPRPAGRGQQPRPSPVQQLAESHGLPVLTPTSLKTAETQQQFAALGLDAAVVVAYGLLLPRAILESPRLGCLNVHASLLPRWRGAAPIQRAILAGDRESGITIMQMDQGLDTGPMLLRRAIEIGLEETGASLHDRLAPLGRRADRRGAGRPGGRAPPADPATGRGRHLCRQAHPRGGTARLAGAGRCSSTAGSGPWRPGPAPGARSPASG